MRIVFTGGGTGGHVFPNLAVIKEVRGQRSEVSVFYIGEKGAMEEKLVVQAGIPFYGIYAGKLRRYFDFKNFVDVFKLPVGFFQAFFILRKLRPQIIFAKGGYVSVPVVIAARFLGLPVWLHESDFSPGLANKICSRFAKKIFVSFEESRRFFSGCNVEVVGNPIRKWLLKGDKEIGYRLTGFSREKPVILIMGGSTGAQSLNKLVEKILPKLLKHTQIVHIIGVTPTSYKLQATSYKQFEFLNEDLAHIYAISNLIISRAGSGAIFEILALKKPMILVPLPAEASRGDQIENALVFAQRGWARVIHQDKVTPEEFLKEILDLLNDKKAQTQMIENQKRVDYGSSALKIAKAILCEI
ncbi:undecaprenyldiphospho-muramoylpentapeptide beta-N-acetylglucosaminyltransferase [Candidatus Peregrinibacteria bacterium]|nr:undecaprenyldiphospho-muramoylpentapeptide beta-N-acetylglucosaminyltransferase [Candidatus Peregrinibacteria bacterium]